MSSKIIGENVTILDDVIIGENVKIGNNVYIDHNCIIRDNVTIGDNTTIGAASILGEYLVDFYDERKNGFHPLVIGTNSIIRSGTIIYGDTNIGDNFQTGHRVTIREKTEIGNNVRIGTLSDIQGDCVIEDYVNLHSNVHVGMKSHIEKYVWIFPYCILTNDPTPPSNNLQGVHIKQYAIVSTNSIILPGKTIGENSLIGAGSIVTKDVDELECVVGNPAKVICKVTDIRNKETGEKLYPWPNSFDRGMPWENIDFEEWKKE